MQIVWTVRYNPDRGVFGGTVVTGELGPFKVEHFIDHTLMINNTVDTVKLCLAKELTDLATGAESPEQQPRPRA